MNPIGREVERETRRAGFNVIRDLCGHGVGRTIHEAPSIPNYLDLPLLSRLTEGLVITIGANHSRGEWERRFTAGSLDGSLGGWKPFRPLRNTRL